MTGNRALVRIASSVLLLALIGTPLFSAQPERRRGMRLGGDWRVKMKVGEMEWESILSFSRGAERQLTGEWISLWGVSELKDVTFEDGKLAFTQSRPGRDGETVTSKFAGTIDGRSLTGTLTTPRGEMKIEGARTPWMPRVVGRWEMTLEMGEREVTTTLVVSRKGEEELAVAWESSRVEHTISDVAYERGRLTFRAQSKMGEREWASTFEGTFRGDTCTGTIRSDRGEIPVFGKRLGAAAIGTWNLEVAFGERSAKQRLRILPDLSALYGSIPVEKVEIADGKVSFKLEQTFGERTFEMEFEGAIEEDRLTGKMTTGMGDGTVKGQKVARRRRGEGRGGRSEGTP